MAYVIDNKKVDLTASEYGMYQKIVASYTVGSNKGEDLFIDLFEVDGSGTIIFLKPPNTRRTSFEVFLFLMSIMQNQHLRNMYKLVDEAIAKMNEKLKEKTTSQ